MLYPITSETRGLVDLNGIWKFKIDKGNGFDEKWFESSLTDTMDMIVPASYKDQTILQELRTHHGLVWYERSFTIPYYMLNERLILRFGAATHVAKVYMNGKVVTEHKAGFLPFEVEINDYLKRGHNRLTIVANNIVEPSISKEMTKEEPETYPIEEYFNIPQIDMNNYSSLHQPVKIYTTPKTYVKDVTVITDFNEDLGYVNYKIDVVGEYEDVRVSIFDESRYQKAITEGTDKTLLIRDVQLWEPLDAYLYQMKVEVLHEDQVVDVYEMPFGIRTVEVKEGEFLINNKPFYFKGFGKHKDSPFSSRAINEPVNVLDFNLMKWIGANSFRTAHYPFSEELMRLADRLGFVVIGETPAAGLNSYLQDSKFENEEEWGDLEITQQHQKIVQDYIDRDKNHPSVVMWSIANDPYLEWESAFDYFEPLVEIARDSDPQNRPITIVTHYGIDYETERISELTDVISLNRYFVEDLTIDGLKKTAENLTSEFAEWHEKYPNKPIFMSEYGLDSASGMRAIKDELFTEDYQVQFLEMYHTIFDQYDLLIGEHIWNFASDKNILSIQDSAKEIFSHEGIPKVTAKELKKRWDSIPNYGYKQ